MLAIFRTGDGGERIRAGDRQQRRDFENLGVRVQANLFRLAFDVSGVQTWYKYHIQINHSNRMPRKDADGNDLRDANGRIIYGDPVVGRSIFDDRDLSGDTEADQRKQERRNESSHLTRRIIQKLQSEFRLSFVTDGSRLAISAQRLEGLSTNVDDRPKRQKKSTGARAAAGIYGKLHSVIAVRIIPCAILMHSSLQVLRISEARFRHPIKPPKSNHGRSSILFKFDETVMTIIPMHSLASPFGCRSS